MIVKNAHGSVGQWRRTTDTTAWNGQYKMSILTSGATGQEEWIPGETWLQENTTLYYSYLADCEIWGPHDSDHDDYSLLGCNAAYFRKCSPNYMLSHSRRQQSSSRKQIIIKTHLKYIVKFKKVSDKCVAVDVSLSPLQDTGAIRMAGTISYW
jgi:hypothetical protein